MYCNLILDLRDLQGHRHYGTFTLYSKGEDMELNVQKCMKNGVDPYNIPRHMFSD